MKIDYTLNEVFHIETSFISSDVKVVSFDDFYAKFKDEFFIGHMTEETRIFRTLEFDDWWKSSPHTEASFWEHTIVTESYEEYQDENGIVWIPEEWMKFSQIVINALEERYA